MIDFTNSSIVPGRAYNGANGSKIAVSYHNEVYMLKFPPAADKKPTELSYTNGCRHDLRFDRLSNRHHKSPERFLSPIRHRKVSIDHSSFPETCISALILDFGRKYSGLT